MSTVVEDPLVAQPLNVTSFIASREELRLVKKARRHRRNQDGEVVDTTSGQVVPFVPFADPEEVDPDTGKPKRYGRFDCPREGVVQLEAGEEADAAEVHAWLMKHRLIGNRGEGFWVRDVKAPQVTSAEMSRLMEAAFDEDMLTAIIAQEEKGWQRDEILTPARESLQRLRDLKAQAASQPAAKPKAKA